MTMIRGVVRPGNGDGQNWENGLMELIRERTGFAYLIPGTLNIEVADARHEIRADHQLTLAENSWRPEGVTFERCRIWGKGMGLRALFIRTSTDYRGDHKVLEFMAACRLRNLFGLVDGDEVQIEFFDSA